MHQAFRECHGLLFDQDVLLAEHHFVVSIQHVGHDLDDRRAQIVVGDQQGALVQAHLGEIDG